MSVRYSGIPGFLGILLEKIPIPGIYNLAFCILSRNLGIGIPKKSHPKATSGSESEDKEKKAYLTVIFQRPSMRSLCDRIFLHCFDAPLFSRDMISNFDRLDRWLLEIYGGIENAHTTLDHIKICFFRNLSLEAFSYLFQNASVR